MVEEQQGGGRWRTGAIALAVVAVILIGVIVGYVASGGLDSPEAAPSSTTSTTVPVATTTVPATVSTTEVVTTTTLSVTPSPTVPPDVSVENQITFTATEDTFVDVTETAPVGHEPVLSVENDPPEQQQALLRFELVGIPSDVQIESAVLRLHIEEAADEVVNLLSVEGDWSEAETTASNAPTPGEVVASFVPETALTTVEIDVTELIEGDGRADFYLAATSPRTAIISSRETINPPTLVVTWG